MTLENKFEIDEIFFSITDQVGKILFGNDIFCRLSEYTHQELSGKPHSIIRHPDMPKSIFKIMWDTLKEGNPFFGYVKNRSKNGNYYWVFALVFPYEDKYISIRLKPVAVDLLEIDALYTEIILYEREHFDLNECVKYTLDLVQNRYKTTIVEFLKFCLVNESLERQKQMRRFSHLKGSNLNKIQTYEQFRMILDSVNLIRENSQMLSEIFDEINIITKNLLIAAANLGDQAATTVVIAHNLDLLNKEIRNGSKQFIQDFDKFYEQISVMLSHIAIVQYEKESLDKLTKSLHVYDFKITVNDAKHYLHESLSQHSYELSQLLLKIKSDCFNLHAFIADFIRLSLSINVISISGKIETTYIANSEGAMDIILQLEDMKIKNDLIKEKLKLLAENVLVIDDFSQNIMNDSYK